MEEKTREELKSPLTPQPFNISRVGVFATNINDANLLSSITDKLVSQSNTNIFHQVGKKENSSRVDNLKRDINFFSEWLITYPRYRTETDNRMPNLVTQWIYKEFCTVIKLTKCVLFTCEYTDDVNNVGKRKLDVLLDAMLKLMLVDQI